MRGDGRVFKRTGTSRWWIAYWVHGKEFRESGGRSEAEARRRLRARLREIHGDRFVGPQAERLTIDELLDALLVHLEMKGAKALVSLRSHLKPVRAGFGLGRAADLTTAAVERYAAGRLALRRARATVNRELQPLKQAFNLAKRQGRIAHVPYIPLLTEDNARQGFFEHKDFQSVAALLPDPVADIARFAYLSGWRKGEILPLRWDAVDRAGREVRLRTSKTGRGRVLPLEGALWKLMEHRWAARKFKAPGGVTGLSDYVFHRGGRPVTDFKRSWAAACEKAWIPGKLFHDLRRTAVRNMIRAGVPQSVAMAISGHRTVSMFHRYNITTDEDMRLAIRQTQAHRRARRFPKRAGANGCERRQPY